MEKSDGGVTLFSYPAQKKKVSILIMKKFARLPKIAAGATLILFAALKLKSVLSVSLGEEQLVYETGLVAGMAVFFILFIVLELNQIKKASFLKNAKKRELSDIAVVVRSCGERTTPLLLKTVECLLPDCDIYVIETRPFFKAVIEMFSWAKHNPAKFILALDADLILSECAPEILLKTIRGYDCKNTLRVRFGVRDKFTGTREAGNHLYNNRYSRNLYRYLIKMGDAGHQRPESKAVSKLARKRGLNSNVLIKDQIGSHGYEQYYRHIYQGMFNWSVKSPRNRAKATWILLQARVEENSDDFDYQIALEGFVAGQDASDVILDSAKYFDVSALLEKIGISEKSTLSVEEIEQEI